MSSSPNILTCEQIDFKLNLVQYSFLNECFYVSSDPFEYRLEDETELNYRLGLWLSSQSFKTSNQRYTHIYMRG